MKIKILLALFVAIGLSMTTAGVHAEIIGDFDDASGMGVDTYPGVTGEGWGGVWTRKASGASAWAGIREPGNPYYIPFDADNDNYLTLKSSSSGTGKSVVCRDFQDASGDVDFTEDYIISFSLRPDDLSTYSATTDDLTIFTNPTATYNPTTSSTFMAKVAADHSDPSRAKQWYFLDGPRGGSDANAVALSGIYLVEGHIYDFEITMHPGTSGYDVTLTDTTAGLTYSSLTDITLADNDLGWRGAVNGKYLSFGARESNSGDVIAVSVDNIRIAQVPEPSTLVLLASALVGLLIWRKR